LKFITSSELLNGNISNKPLSFATFYKGTQIRYLINVILTFLALEETEKRLYNVE
jgi:hypothetical protein